MLIHSETKEPFGKLPRAVPNGMPYTVLRYTSPTKAKPSGEVILRHMDRPELFRAAPPTVGLQCA